METPVRAYRRASLGDDQVKATRQREQRYLDMYTDDDGMLLIRGRLPQEVAALLEKAPEAAMNALRGDEKKEERDKNDSAESWRFETFSQRRVDALALLAEEGLLEGSSFVGPTGVAFPYALCPYRSTEGQAKP